MFLVAGRGCQVATLACAGVSDYCHLLADSTRQLRPRASQTSQGTSLTSLPSQLTLMLTGQVPLDKFPSFQSLGFLICSADNFIYLVGLLWGVNEVMHLNRRSGEYFRSEVQWQRNQQIYIYIVLKSWIVEKCSHNLLNRYSPQIEII